MDNLKAVKPVTAAVTGAADPIVTRLAAEDRVRWYRKSNLRVLYFWLFLSCMGVEITSGFDSQMINALQIVPAWTKYLGDSNGQLSPALKGIIAASYSLGAVLSLPFVPIINERLGRRWPIMIGALISVAGAIIQCFSQNAGNYIFARIVLGFGVPVQIVAASSLIGELAYPKERPIMTSLFNVSYWIGAITASGICFATNNIPSDWSWRLPSILQACPSLLQIAFIFMLPESPRWLITKDRAEEANAILVKYHAEGDASSEFVRAEMTQIRATIQLEMEASRRSWKDMVATSGMRRRVLVGSMLGLFTQWSGNTLISYYLSDLLNNVGVTNSITKQQINIGNTVWSGITSLTAALLITKWKRRTMYLTCTISLLLCYIAWTISTESATSSIGPGKMVNTAAVGSTIAFIFVYAPCYNIGYNAASYTYLVEIFPYAYRSRGITIFQLFGRLATFFSTFVNPIGLANIGWKYLLMYVCWLAFEVVFVYFAFPETSGRTIEELAFLFEDKALADQVVHAVEKVIDDSPSLKGNVSVREKEV